MAWRRLGEDGLKPMRSLFVAMHKGTCELEGKCPDIGRTGRTKRCYYNPKIPDDCVSLSIYTNLVGLCFVTYVLCINEIEWFLLGELDIRFAA